MAEPINLEPEDIDVAYNPDFEQGEQIDSAGIGGNGEAVATNVIEPDTPKVYEGIGDTTNRDTMYGLPAQKAFEEPEDTSLFDLTKAAFAEENTLGTLLNYGLNPYGNYKDDNYNVLDDPSYQVLNKFDQMELIHSQNPEYTQNKLIELEKQKANRKVIAQSGLAAMPVIVAVSFLEPADAIYLAFPFAKAAKTLDRGQKALRTATAGATSAVAQEAFLYENQMLRTNDEFETNLLYGAMFSFGLGGAAGYLSKTDLDAQAKQAKDFIEGDAPSEVPTTKVDSEPATIQVRVSEAEQGRLIDEAIEVERARLIESSSSKLSKGDTKLLKAEKKSLEYDISILPQRQELLSTQTSKGTGKAKAEQKKDVTERLRDAEAQQKSLQDKIDIIDQKLEASGVGAKAEADLSRLDAKIYSPELQAEIDGIKTKEVSVQGKAEAGQVKSDDSAGAMRVSDENIAKGVRDGTIDEGQSTNIDDYELMTSGVGSKTVLKTVITSAKRLANSRSLVARQSGMALSDSTLHHKGNYKGKSLTPERGSIEGRKREKMGDSTMVQDAIQQAFFKYRGVTGKGYTQKLKGAAVGILDKMGSGEPAHLSRAEFNAAVSMAVDSGKKSDIPEVNQAAKEVSDYFERMLDEAIEVGLLSPDLKDGDPNYLHRVWNQAEVRNKMPELRQAIASYFARTLKVEQTKGKLKVDDQALEMLSAKKEQVLKLRQEAQGDQALSDLYTHETMVIDRALEVANGRLIDSDSLNKINDDLTKYLNDRAVMIDDTVNDIGNALDLMKSGSNEIPLNLPNSVYTDANRFDKARKYVRIGKDTPADVDDLKGKARADVKKLNKLRDEWETGNKKGTDAEFKAYARKRFLQDEFKAEALARTQSRIKVLKRKQQRALSNLEESLKVSKLTRADLEQYAQKTIDNILGQRQGQTGADILPAELAHYAGAFKQRQLNMPHSTLAKLGVVETDAEKIVQRYTQSTAAQIEIVRDFGDIQASGLFKELDADYDKLYAGLADKAAKEKWDAKELAKQNEKLAREKTRDITDISVQLQRLQGTYKQPDDPTHWGYRTIQTIMNINYSSSLGGMTVSALPDMYRGPMKYGLRPYSKALAAYRNSMHKDLAEWEIRRAGVANELITSNRAREMGDVTDYTYGTSRFEKGVQRISDYMGDLTFMNPWNDTWKMKTGIYVQDAVLSTQGQ